MVYVLDDAHRDEITRKLVAEFAQVDGVSDVVTPDEFAALSLATRDQDPRAPDFWLSAKSGYSFTDTETGDDVTAARETRGGTHGYLPDQAEMLGTLVISISGDGVAPGKRLGKVNSTDVAPTMAKLLGVELPSAAGRVLDVE